MAIPKDDKPDSIADKKPKSEGIDSPAGSQSGDSKRSPHNKAVGGKPLNTEKAKFAEGKDVTVENGTGPKALETAVQKFVPKADFPTTASAPPGTNLASIIAQVDPSGKSQVFANMIKSFAIIKMLMTLAGGSKGGSSMGQSQKNTLVDAFSEALCILCNRTSFVQVTKALNLALIGGTINNISPDYQDIVKNGIAKLIEKALIFGENNIPIKPTPLVFYVEKKYTDVVYYDNLLGLPDLSTKNYYNLGEDPYIGYMHFTTPDSKIALVRRSPLDYPYSNAEAECLALAEKGIANDLYPYIINDRILKIPTLTASILNTILEYHKVQHENNGMERVVGKNSSVNLMALAPSILGAIGTVTSLASASFLPTSVLGSSVSSSITNFTKNLAMTNVMAGIAGNALSLPSPLAGLGGLGALAGSLGGLGISLPGLVSSLGGSSSLLNNINTFGAVSAITGALASNADISDKLLSTGVSLSALALASQGTSVASSSITKAMAVGGASALALGATASLLENIGV